MNTLSMYPPLVKSLEPLECAENISVDAQFIVHFLNMKLCVHTLPELVH